MDKVLSLASYQAGETDTQLIARLKAENAALNAMNARARVSMTVIGDAVIGTDATGRVDYLNHAAERLCGYSTHDLKQVPADEVFVFRSAETNAVLANPVVRCLVSEQVVARSGRSLLVTRGGCGCMVQETATPVFDQSGALSGVVLVLKNLSLENDLSERLSWHKRHDILTGLINREEFERRLTREISLLAAGRAPIRHALLYLDLDRFRVTNDAVGHAAGDHALLEVARLIQDQIRSSDLATRLGGDEFAVLLNDCSVDDAAVVAQKIRLALEQHRFNWRNHPFKHTASIGVVDIDAASCVNDVLASADVACYCAKEAGRNAVHCARADEKPGLSDVQWVSQIGLACDEDRFELYCQPIVPVSGSKQQPHFELLLRFNDADGNVVPATDFLPAAERFNMMPAIDRWVLNHTLSRLLGPARQDEESNCMVSVNLSGTSLSDPSFLDFARGEVRNAGLADNELCFEITETAAIGNIPAVARFVRELRELGCAFSLDDFGSGLSTFAYLKELPVDFLKIDGRFIRYLNKDSIDRTLVMAIAKIGEELDIRTVAEQVEDVETLAHLETLGIDFAQGYYFSRPVPVQDHHCLNRLASARIFHEGGANRSKLNEQTGVLHSPPNGSPRDPS